MYKYVRIRDICLLGLLQTLSVELLNEHKYSAILDDLNRFQEVHKQPQHLNICSYMLIPDRQALHCLITVRGLMHSHINNHHRAGLDKFYFPCLYRATEALRGSSDLRCITTGT